MASVLIDLYRSNKEGDWNMHLTAIRCSIPLFFFFDRINYKRCALLYFEDYMALKSGFPDSRGNFSNGGFVVYQPNNYYHKSGNTNETPLGQQNQFTESNLINDYIDADTILKEINDFLTRNNDFLETVNENADTNFNDMLHNNIQCVTANYANSGLYDAAEY